MSNVIIHGTIHFLIPQKKVVAAIFPVFCQRIVYLDAKVRLDVRHGHTPILVLIT